MAPAIILFPRGEVAGALFRCKNQKMPIYSTQSPALIVDDYG
jgi:hypothetical protein